MNIINKVSDITVQDCADYLRIGELTNDEINTLSTLLTVAKAYAVQYTGRSLIELDDYSDVVIVILIIVQDMYDNRTLYVDNANLNNVVDSILGMHSVNLL